MKATAIDIRNMPLIESPDLFDYNGVLNAQPADFYRQFSRAQLQVFGHMHALYSFPTTEAAELISHIIGGREKETIEIGSGNGGWSKALKIHGTDSYQQADPLYQSIYALHGQPVISYGPHVEELNAMSALYKYRPRIVVASWVTHLYDAKRPELKGNVVGVDEHELLSLVDEYIFIGNLNVHQTKPIFIDWTNGKLPGWRVNVHLQREPREIFSRSSAGQDFIVHMKRAEDVQKS